MKKVQNEAKTTIIKSILVALMNILSVISWWEQVLFMRYLRYVLDQYSGLTFNCAGSLM